MRIGGPAQFWVEPRTEEAFARTNSVLPARKYSALHHWTRLKLLVRDGGIRGVVVHPSRRRIRKVEIDGNEITAGAGAKLKEVAYAAKAAGSVVSNGWKEFPAKSAAACA